MHEWECRLGLQDRSEVSSREEESDQHCKSKDSIDGDGEQHGVRDHDTTIRYFFGHLCSASVLKTGDILSRSLTWTTPSVPSKDF